MSLQYRRDVDGLRAIAVIPVVLYHYGVPGFAGGYVGVDVFFVISGFLITSLILSEVKAGDFSFLNFYERRIRRIFPALFLVLLVTAVIAFTEFFPFELNNYAKSIAATAGFLSNAEFWREAGYFDAAADQKPLLHTWSLAVEEQFYLVFPLLVIAIARFLKARYAVVFLLISAGSLALSTWAAFFAPNFAFYFLPTRMWELLLGALIAVNTDASERNYTLDTAMAVLGAGMIAAAVMFFSPETHFPGAAALLPCLGAGFVILAGRSSATPVLSWGPVVFIGNISYSLYLWHWPLYVFAKYQLERKLTTPETTVLIVLSTIVAALSWRFIERPFRGKRGILTRPFLFGTAGSAIAVSMAFGVVLYAFHGLPQRFSPQVQVALAAADEDPLTCRGMVELTTAGRMCGIGIQAGEHPAFLIWGDSHARALTPAIFQAADRHGVSGMSVIRDGCPPLIGMNRTVQGWGCKDHNDLVFAYLKSKGIDTAILISRWSFFVEGDRYGKEKGDPVFLEDAVSRVHSKEENRKVFERAFSLTLEMLRASGFRVIVVGPVPEIGVSVPTTLARKLAYGQSVDFGPTLSAFETRNRIVLSVFGRYAHEADFVYPHLQLCATGRCAVSHEGKPLYWDDNHLSLFGAQRISVIFEPLFANVKAHETSKVTLPFGSTE